MAGINRKSTEEKIGNEPELAYRKLIMKYIIIKAKSLFPTFQKVHLKKSVDRRTFDLILFFSSQKSETNHLKAYVIKTFWHNTINSNSLFGNNKKDSKSKDKVFDRWFVENAVLKYQHYENLATEKE